MKKLILLIITFYSYFCGQTQSLEEIMENYFKAIGGRDIIAKAKVSKEVSYNWFRKKPIDNPDSSKGIMVQTILKEPFYKRFISYDAKGNWSNEFYYNDKGSVLAMGSIVQKSSDRIQISVCLSKDLLNWYEKDKLKYFGKEKLRGVDCDVVSKTDDGKTEFYFFNSKTHLLEASKNKDWPDRLTYYSFYKETNLLNHPFLLETYDQGSLIYRQKTETFEYNPEINNEIFFFNEKEYEARSRPKVLYESVKLDAKEADLEGFIQTNFSEKRVLVDMWATWCAPCKKEFKNYDSTYYSLMDAHNISLVYFSIDKDSDRKKWESDVSKLGLKGYHVRANKRMVESVQRSIFDNGPITIPRYILVDEEGNILSKDFARPSDPDFTKKINQEFSSNRKLN